MPTFNISTRLRLTLGLLTLLLLGVAGAAWTQIAAMKTASDDLANNWLPSVEHVNQMNTGASDFRVAEQQLVMSDDPKEQQAAKQSMDKTLAAFNCIACHERKGLGGIAPERPLLAIGRHFDREPDHPHRQADGGERIQRAWRPRGHRRQRRRHRDQHPQRLQRPRQ